ncbi:MAG: hypothetical protein IKL82_05895 [Clostridia bacterium]|nr:hypothetical protein [Clostridia bacterium]
MIKNKPLKVIVSVLLSLLIFACVLMLGIKAWFQLPQIKYYNASTVAFEIPGISDNFVPQGFCYDEQNNVYIVSGYLSKDGASPLYVLDGTNGKVLKKINLAKSNGKEFTGHSGGVAVWGDYLYISAGSGVGVYVFDYSSVLSAENGGVVKYTGKFSTEKSDDDYVGSSYVTVYDNKIIIGEFYSEKGYDKPDSHKVTCESCGETNGALAIEYNLDANYTYGINPTPTKVYSTREKVQGVNVDNGKFYLSTSQAFNPSYIYSYNVSDLKLCGNRQTIGYTLPLYTLCSCSHNKTYKTPPMAEEIVFRNGKLYIMSEFACNKYILGKFAGGKWCYATDLEKM